MTIRSVVCLTVSFLVLGLVPALADTQIIPQVADGAGWSTTIVLANKTSSTQSVALSFNMDTSNSATTPWTPPFLEGVSLSSISLAAGSTLFLHTPGTSTTLTQGWGQIDAAAGVTGYAIFTQRVPGQPAQDGTAPAVSASSRILVPFDNTSGLVSAFAVANPNGTAETVQANVRTSDGTFSGTLATLPAKGQMTFLIKDVFPGTAGKSGLAEFYVASGSIAIIALRANGIAFTAAPVYFQSGDSDHRRSQHYANLLASDPGDPAGCRRRRLGDHDCPDQHLDRRPAVHPEFQTGRPERGWRYAVLESALSTQRRH